MPHPSRELYWSAILADFRCSGLTHVEFCRRRRLSLSAFVSALRNHTGCAGDPAQLAATRADDS
jgi:hypothetical protein